MNTGSSGDVPPPPPAGDSAATPDRHDAEPAPPRPSLTPDDFDIVPGLARDRQNAADPSHPPLDDSVPLFEDPLTTGPISLRDELIGPKNRPDPWAHRRGEPRTFAFFWTMFILIAVAGSVMWVARYAALTTGAYAPAARIMLIVVGVGMTLLWPMVRLSQATPPRPVPLHALIDTWIVLLPIQVVLWPLVFLAGWPVNIVLGVAGNFLAWGLLTGGILAIALAGPTLQHPSDPRLARRTLWMLTMVALTLGAPLIILLSRMANPDGSIEEPLSMFSPLTSVAVLTGRGMLGPQNPIAAWQWECILAVLLAGCAAWVLAFVRHRLGKPVSDA